LEPNLIARRFQDFAFEPYCQLIELIRCSGIAGGGLVGSVQRCRQGFCRIRGKRLASGELVEVRPRHNGGRRPLDPTPACRFRRDAATRGLVLPYQ